MDYSRYKSILVERRGKVLTLTMNRPEALNAVNQQLHDELANIFYDVQHDTAAEVVVLTGAGRAFCAGGDLAWMKDTLERREEEFLSPVDGKRIVFSMLDLEKPLIARVNGHATGLGCTLALFCDVIYAAKNAKIGDPHVKAGVVAGDGGAVIWPQLIGYARAKEWLMTGDLMSADEAAAMGLINRVFEPAELDEKVYAFADRLANGPTQAIKWTKVSVNIGLKQLAHSIMDTSLAYEWLTFGSKDHAEAVRAFTEKREPKWQGK